jgi:hypothetical protein
MVCDCVHNTLPNFARSHFPSPNYQRYFQNSDEAISLFLHAPLTEEPGSSLVQVHS